MKRLLVLVAVLALSAGVAQAALIAHWQFEGDATDSVGSLDGTLNGNPEFIDGPVGRAIKFDGDGDFVVVNGTLGGLQELTISMWIAIDGLGGSRNSLFHKNDWVTGSLHFLITGDAVIQFAVCDNGPNNVDSATTLPVDSTWHHIAVVYSVSANSVEFYVDGVLSEIGSPIGFAGYASPGPLNLFPGQIGGWNGERLWNGAQDDIRIYDETLDAAAIADLAAGGEGEGEGEGPAITQGAPVAGMVGLGMIAGVCALGGALVIRRKK